MHPVRFGGPVQPWSPLPLPDARMRLSKGDPTPAPTVACGSLAALKGTVEPTPAPARPTPAPTPAQTGATHNGQQDSGGAPPVAAPLGAVGPTPAPTPAQIGATYNGQQDSGGTPPKAAPLGSTSVADVGGSAKGDPHLVTIKGEKADVNQPGEYSFLRVPRDASQGALLELRAEVAPDASQPCSVLIVAVKLVGAWLGPQGSIAVRAPRVVTLTNEAQVGLQVRQHIPASEKAQPLAVRVGSSGQWTPIWEFRGYDGGEAANVSAKAVLRNPPPRDSWDAHNAAGLLRIRVRDAEVKVVQKRPGWGFLNIHVAHLQRTGRADIGGLLGLDGVGERAAQPTEECLAYQRRGKQHWQRTVPTGLGFQTPGLASQELLSGLGGFGLLQAERSFAIAELA